MSGKDGEQPAFPCTDPAGVRYHGMMLRDYFAAAALQGIISGGAGSLKASAEQLNCGPCTVAAMSAYEFADAMLEARQL